MGSTTTVAASPAYAADKLWLNGRAAAAAAAAPASKDDDDDDTLATRRRGGPGWPQSQELPVAGLPLPLTRNSKPLYILTHQRHPSDPRRVARLPARRQPQQLPHRRRPRLQVSFSISNMQIPQHKTP
jgi:hypothetical protein